MPLHRPWLLLLVCVALSDQNSWNFELPRTLYAWEGTCVWIPCTYTLPKLSKQLSNITVYLNPVYNDVIKSYTGTILFNHTRMEEKPPSQGKVLFVGDKQQNCTFSIRWLQVNDSGELGIRMQTESDKWMEKINLNISKKPLAPHIQLPSADIQEHQLVTLTCSVNFSCWENPIQLQWSLDGTVVQETILTTKLVSTQSKLTFTPQWTHHGQNLTCQLQNATERHVLSEDTVRLDVKHVPQLKIVEISPRNSTVLEGASVTMTCQVISSNPDYHSIFWFKNEMQLPEQKTLTLTLPKVSKDMSGKYRCQACNAMGLGKSEEVTLNVLYAPKLSKVQISPPAVLEGKPVELICISQANPPPTNYTWYHNAKEMPGRTEEKIRIPNALLLHAGSYSCLAESSLGRGQRGQETKLDIQYPPKEVTAVIQSPTPIREGDSVTLACSYNSSNPSVYRYEWRLPGNKPSSSEVVTISKVAWDAKTVTCAACNSWCSWAPLVNLDVQYAPREVKVRQQAQAEIRAGQRVTLQCECSGSRPQEVHFSWKKNGRPVQEGKELTFNSITPEDSGSYSCLANNSVGQRTSEPWTLQVLYPPRKLQVIMTPGNTVMEGKQVVLTCESDANPPVSHYVWLDWNNQEFYFGQMLKLEPTTIQHSGAYRCQGTNRLGRAESPPRTLTIYYSPETIGRRAAVGIGCSMALLILTIWGFKLRQKWKRIRSQQGAQDNFSGQSFFVKNPKVRRPPLPEGPHSLGCYNPVMEDGISYATLRFPEVDTSIAGDTGTAELQRPSLSGEDTVTYSVVQKRRVADYENVPPDLPEDEGIHYSELVRFGMGVRPQAQEDVDYVTLKQ
ncbi:B-cell receptor CD22 isoform X1 [Ochotona curzoniae]|uniref:B-cell receptor CD22 isoform X1 n=1 Tax=Ochotona curzoniae TaxID=130825 RepID=UPI001B347D50|nr:B-cell receptor CD22 isoform X1 [Ochotona curzoniae]